MNTSDIQQISSGLNKLATQTRAAAGKDSINALNRSFRSWASQTLNAANPEAKVGTQLEGLYDNSEKVYEGFKRLNPILSGKIKDASPDDFSQLQSWLKSQSKGANKFALQDAVKEWAKTSGVDLTNSIKVMQYTQTLKPLAKKAFFEVLQYAGLPAAGLTIAQHLSGSSKIPNP